MFRFAVAVLAVIGLVFLLGGASAAALGVGWLLLAPFVFLFKVVLFFMLFGAIAQFVSHRGGRNGGRRWDGPRGRTWNRSGGCGSRRAGPRVDYTASHDETSDSRPADEQRFDEWHRMQHAKKEVDSWVEIPDTSGSGTRENH
jgi:hypothetical protein